MDFIIFRILWFILDFGQLSLQMPHSQTFPEHCPHQIPKMSKKARRFVVLVPQVDSTNLVVWVIYWTASWDLPRHTLTKSYPSVDCFHGIFFQNLPRNLPDHALACSFKTAEKEQQSYLYTSDIVFRDCRASWLCFWVPVSGTVSFFPFFFGEKDHLFQHSPKPQRLNVVRRTHLEVTVFWGVFGQENLLPSSFLQKDEGKIVLARRPWNLKVSHKWKFALKMCVWQTQTKHPDSNQALICLLSCLELLITIDTDKSAVSWQLRMALSMIGFCSLWFVVGFLRIAIILGRRCYSATVNGCKKRQLDILYTNKKS